MSMYCVSVFDGEQFAGEWFDSLKDAKGYMDACFEDGTWKDIQLQQWTEEDLLEFMEKGMRSQKNRLRVACNRSQAPMTLS